MTKVVQDVILFFPLLFMSRICFFSSKSYDQRSFQQVNAWFKHELHFCPERLNKETVNQASWCDTVCIFVNDVADTQVVQSLASLGVKLIVLRCAGFNNVDLDAAKQYGIQVLRVPAYSPHAVAEFAIALILALNRNVFRASSRTRSYNFAIEGLEW